MVRHIKNPALELLAVTAGKAASRTPSASLTTGANGTPDVSRFATSRLDKICPPVVISCRRADIPQTVRLVPLA
jgi:hypothetical protein